MFSAKDLFNTCKQYGHAVDVFIPNKRMKAGKRFGFVCFIKIFDVERLVNNLCTVWVGRFKLHANIARFQRTPLNNESTQVKNKFRDNRSNTNDYNNEKGVKRVANSYVHVVKGGPRSVNVEIEPTLALHCKKDEESKKESGEYSQRGVLMKYGNDLLIISDYAPQELIEKKMLWDYLVYVINNWKGANVFNMFIANASLEEVPLGGSSFNWCHKSVEDTLNEAPVEESNDMTNMKKKLKHLKQKIREWNKDKKKNARNRTIRFKEELADLDATIDKELELEVSKEEIKRAVWDCRTDKSPGPDEFTLGSNSSFIALIPKTPDASMVKDFRPISLIGILYKIIAKIFTNRLVVVLGDIINEVQSDFVADRQIIDGFFILNELFQPCKSKKKQSLMFKIQSCLRSSRGSIIVNGSPMEEFQFYKGLKQGDPLSLFLFILILESLHISFQRVLDVEMFKGITLSLSLQLSYMFYADDAVFVGQWSDVNVDTIVHVLECFFRASGMRINMSKSKLMRIYVEEDKIELVASKIGCFILKPSFSYLGSKVGGLMSRVQSWNEVVDRVTARISKWKMKTLSIGGSLTLLKPVLGSMPIYHMSIFKAPMTIHGDDGKVGKNVKSAFPSIWLDIVLEMDLLKKQDIDIAVDVATKLAYSSLDSSFRRGPRGGVEQEQYIALMNQGSGDFSVASVRKLIDDKMLSEVATKTRWVNVVPIKVNVHAWKFSHRIRAFAISPLELQGSISGCNGPSPPSGFKVDDMVAYGFAIAEEEDTHEPITFQEAINSSDKDEWVRAMEEEISSLMKNHTWELVDQQHGQKLVSFKWLYKIKEVIQGVQKPRYKARLVAHRFTQRAGIDYNEVFSPVVRHTSIRVILSLIACEDYELEQLDVKMAFLHDDMLIACKSKSEIEYTKGLLRKEFDMKELGPARKILGMEIVKDRVDNGKSVPVPLGAHFKVSLKVCPSNDWDVERMSKVPYVNAVGSLMYLMVCSRPDITYVVSIVSLVYGRDHGKHVDVDGFVNVDYAKDPDKGRSITGYVFMVHGCVVSWKATLQHVVALSTAEAEYMVLTEAVKESILLKGLLIELGVNLRSVVVNCDNQSAIHLSRNAMFHERTKHINVRYHFIREIVKSKEIKVAKISTKDNAADVFTKVVPGPKFKYCMEILGVEIN
nr:RNA-directed DNA polymerase, eukaryota [Tanacetum cinerariifolium]